MPPEPLPWDRTRDFRKHERSGGSEPTRLGGFGGAPRWRDTHPPPAPPPHPHPYHSHHGPSRWFSDFRSRPPPPGHGKQGGWHMYPEESSHGFSPYGSRYNERSLDDENCRSFGSRSDGRYFRNSRENRGSFSQKDWRSHSWETVSSPSATGRPNNEVNDQKLAENVQTCNNSSSNNSLNPLPLASNSCEQSQTRSFVKVQHDKNDGNGDGLGNMGQKLEKENSLGPIDWKSLKWTRSGSLSSRGSGLSHSSSSKSMTVDPVETKIEVQPKSVTPVQSPTGDAIVCVTSAAPEETSSRKKPRLGWGEGLAKYEKKKVEGPEDGMAKNGLVCTSDVEPAHMQGTSLIDKSPGVTSFSDCASPATPSSVACSSSPGIDEKQSVKSASIDHDATNLHQSPSIQSHTHCDGPTFNLENLDLLSIANLRTMISELVQSDDPTSSDTGFVLSSAMNKLQVWKVDMLKALEMTESEVDLLEHELKAFSCEAKFSCSNPAASSQPVEGHLKFSEDRGATSNSVPRPAPLELMSSEDMIVDKTPAELEVEQIEMRCEDIDSPGSATSKFVELSSSGEDASPFDSAKPNECADIKNLEVKCLGSSLHNIEDTGSVSAPVDGSQLNVISSLGPAANQNLLADIENINNSIVACNKEFAKRAWDELQKGLLANQNQLDVPSVASVSYLQSDPMVVKKFLMRKRFLKFKETVLALKFRVFQHFWKEDRPFPIRKMRTKAHKKLDLSVRTGHCGVLKHRLSSRSRFSSTGGNLGFVPTSEVSDLVSRLLPEFLAKPCRDSLKMPSLILDEKAKTVSRFITSNGLVEDPCALEKERSIINPWTSEEREIFIDKLATFGKDFTKIASFLDHKTTADCVEFYYRNHKSDWFAKAKNKPDFAKQRKTHSSNTYLVASGKRWSRQANAASLDILGAASAIAANAENVMEIQQNCSSRYFFGSSSAYKVPRADDSLLERSNSLDMCTNEKETVAADVLAGICGSISSEAMSSCITSSVDPGEGYQDWKTHRVGSSTRRPLTSEVTQNVGDECSDESCGELDPTDWTDEEKSIFIQAVSSYGKDFTLISRCVRTRSKDQCRVFFSKARKCLGLDLIQPRSGNVVGGDNSGGGSDTEDATVVESGSVICSEKSGSKMEVDIPSPDEKFNYESDLPAMTSKPDLNRCEVNNERGTSHSADTEHMCEDFIADDSQANDKPETDFDVESNIAGRANKRSRDIQDYGPSLASLVAIAEQMEVEADGPDLSSRLGSKTGETSVQVSEEHPIMWKEGRGLQLAEGSLNAKVLENKNSASKDSNGVRSSIEEMVSEGQAFGNAPSLPADAHSSSRLDVAPGNQQKVDLENVSAEKSRVVSFQQHGFIEPVELARPFSAPVKINGTTSNHGTSSAVDANGNGVNQSEIGSSSDSQQSPSGRFLSDNVDSSQILRGYPLSVPNTKEINSEIICKRPFSLQTVGNSNGNFHSERRSECYLQKCNSSRPANSVAQLPLPVREPIRDLSGPHSGSSSNGENPCRNGDVKLFGKILTSSQQNPNSIMQQTSDPNSKPHKVGSQMLSLKLNGDQSVDSNSAQVLFDHSNYRSSENIPTRNFSFWDASRMQTGFSSLPDSALLLAKYPTAFSNCSIPSAKMEQPPTHGMVKTDHNLSGVSVFPTRDLSTSNGVTDYPVFRNQEVQPFTIDMKQSKDALFNEMQRRSGFDVGSGMPQQARGMVGINVVSRGGVLIGGQCSVSDPVAAIKMHYAKTEQYGAQAGNIIREDDSWRSKGDLGR